MATNLRDALTEIGIAAGDAALIDDLSTHAFDEAFAAIKRVCETAPPKHRALILDMALRKTAANFTGVLDELNDLENPAATERAKRAVDTLGMDRVEEMTGKLVARYGMSDEMISRLRLVGMDDERIARIAKLAPAKEAQA